MKYYLLSVCALVLGACQSVPPANEPVRYTHFRVTNYRGELVADWVAEGKFSSAPEGFAVKAVQRTSGPPYPETTRYPNGWRTTVVGPNIVYWTCEKPHWLDHLDEKNR